MKSFVYMVLCISGLAAMVSACNSSKDKIPSGIMPEKKMQLVYTDALIAESYIAENTTQKDSQNKLATKFYGKIFKKYDISRDEYYQSYDYYAKHPAIFEKIMGPVIDSLTAMEAHTPAKPMLPIVIPATHVIAPGAIKEENLLRARKVQAVKK